MEDTTTYSLNYWTRYLRIWLGYIVILLILLWDNGFEFDLGIGVDISFLIAFFLLFMHGLDFLFFWIEKKSIRLFFSERKTTPLVLNILLITFSIIFLYYFNLRLMYFVIIGTPFLLLISLIFFLFF